MPTRMTVPMGDRLIDELCSGNLYSGNLYSGNLYSGNLGIDVNRDVVDSVNAQYDRLAGNVTAETLVQTRLARSSWAKRSLASLIAGLQSESVDRRKFADGLETIARLRTRITVADAGVLVTRQDAVGDHVTGMQLATALADHGDPAIDSNILLQLDRSGTAITRRGPSPMASIRPSRGSSRLDPVGWLVQPAMGDLEFVDGNPDHIRVRGIELRSGDIGIVELEHPGDGIFDSFLQTPGVAPHAMLFVSRRIKIAGQSQPLIQPSLLEIYEGGWRTVPVTTGLGPRFSWYSQWVRPTGLPDDIGRRLSEQLETMESIAFDFQSRKIPEGGSFPSSWGSPSASCTNLIRIPMERAGVSLPYPTTEIHAGAIRNLELLGLPGIGPIHTPTNLLNDSGFDPVGVVDNGFPELGYAQAMVVGRPDLPDTFGGHFCGRPLRLENLPDWKSIRRWKSARAALLIKIGQSDSLLGNVSRKAAGYTASEIPRTASPTTIAFYLRSDMEAGHIMQKRLMPALVRWFDEGRSPRLSDLHAEPQFQELIRAGMADSALVKERWYG